MARYCSWIHLSDIHFQASDAWRDSTARNSLLEYLRAHLESGQIEPPNLIFCTGDIGFGDTSKQKLESQYDDALQFFDELLRITGTKRENLFVVPGNHDVSRGLANKHADARYRQMAKEWWVYESEVNASIARFTKEYQDSITRLATYRQFFGSVCPHVKLGPHLHYTHRTTLEGIEVQIVGMNSAWICSGSEEDRDVWVGAQAQIENVRRDKSLRIGLVHHPLEWITKADAQLLENRMGKDLHILLHGHEHEFREHAFSGGFPVIGTGAVSAATQLEHGIVHCKLNLEDGLLHRSLFLYSPKEGEWRRSLKCEKPLQTPIFEEVVSGTHRAEATKSLQTSRHYSTFFSRPGRLGSMSEISEYDELIEPSATARNRDAEYFKHLWSDSMGPHTIERLAGAPDQLHFDGLASSTRVVQKDNLDAYFLRHVMIEPRVTSTANEDEVDKIDAKVPSFEAFVKEISESPQGMRAKSHSFDSENKVRYLLGDAGIGKTLTVLKAIDATRLRQTDEFGYKTHPIYIDLHQDRTWIEHEPAQAVHLTIERIGSAFYAALPEDAQKGVEFSPGSYKSSIELDAAVRKVALELSSVKIAPLIIFDNGDRFFFENARYRFFPEFARKRDWHLDDTFVALVDRFVSEASLGKIGASVLFVCRRYVYSHCLRVSDGADPSGPIRRDHKVYQLLIAEHDEILESRTRLIREAIKALDGKYRNSKMFADRLAHIETRLATLKTEHFHGNRSVLRTVWEMVHQGHRSWLLFLGSLPIDVGPGAEIADRIFGSPYLLLRLYITNMRKRYSQIQGHFPNIFLNDALVLSREIFAEAHKPHVHTYWLKYLILKWALRQKAGRGRAKVNSESLAKYFVGDLGYEEHLVRLAIGSLADPNSSNCLRIIQPDRLVRHIELLQASTRAEILVEPGQRDNPLCFSFDYLQLITDDYLMALPKCVANQIYVDADLGHSLKTGKAYANGARQTLQKKIPAVLCFYRVLQLSFQYECKFRGILPKLQADGLVPDFNSIEERLLDSIARLDSHFDEGGDLDSMPNPRAEWESLLKDHRIEQSIAEYYTNPRSISL